MERRFYVIKETGELIDMEEIENNYISKGNDGKVYKYSNDQIIKMLHSDCITYMTERKIVDLREAVPEDANSRLIVPRLTIKQNANKIVSKLALPNGYITKYVEEAPEFIMSMKKSKFLSEIAALRKEIYSFLSTNKIAILDTNPANIIKSSQDQKLYLIDHDRDITPSSSFYDKRTVFKKNYVDHNEKKLAIMTYKCLLLALLKYEGIGVDSKIDNPVNHYVMGRLMISDNATFSTTEKILRDYDTIDEYAKTKILQIKGKR